MQDETNQRLLKSTSEVLQHMLVHEIQHSKELKNSDECASQLLKQAGGAYMKHFMDIAAETSNMASLQRAGFIVAAGEVQAIFVRQPMEKFPLKINLQMLMGSWSGQCVQIDWSVAFGFSRGFLGMPWQDCLQII